METQSIAILLAVYEPNELWLTQLLDSLDRQTYPHLHLYVRDDASPTYPLQRLEQMLREHVTRFPFTLRQNEGNLGSNGTFARLVEDCKENYIAFCDHDDVWLPEKLEKSLSLLRESPLHPTLVCANVSVVDGEGALIASRIDEHRRRHVFLRGEGIASQLIYRNFVMGCTVVMERERALRYLPFPDEAVHDHYLAFRAACDGAIDYLDEPVMLYRVYGGNQTGVMTGVKTKEDYFCRRIKSFDDRLRCFEAYSDVPEIQKARAWSHARMDNYNRKCGSFGALYRTRAANPVTTWFELIGLRLPPPLFRLAIRLIRKGIL